MLRQCRGTIQTRSAEEAGHRRTVERHRDPSVKGVGGPTGSCGGSVRRRHRLLWLEQRLRSQNACPGCAEGHRPGQQHALPRVIARCPWRALVVGEGGHAAISKTALLVGSVVGAAVVGAVVGAGRVGGRGTIVGGRIGGGSAGPVTVSGSKGLPGFDVGVTLGIEFLQDEERVRTHEGVRRKFGGDDWLDVAVAGVEAAKKVQHMTSLGDRLANVMERIGEPLQLCTVVVDRQVALLRGAQFSFEVHRALYLVVEEEALDGLP